MPKQVYVHLYTVELDGYKNTNHYGLFTLKIDQSGQVDFEDHLIYFFNNYVTTYSYNMLKNWKSSNINAFIDYYESEEELYLDYSTGVHKYINDENVYVKPVAQDKIK